MAYFEFYVDSGKLNTAGGTSEGNVEYSLAVGGSGCTATDNVSQSNLEDLNNGGWAGVTVGDGVCFDPDGDFGGDPGPKYALVTAINVGADADVITVSPQVTAAAEMGVNVGGAWADPDFAWGQMEIFAADGRFVNGTPPWINVLQGQTHDLTAATITATRHGTATIPLCMGGYQTNPRDGLGTAPIITSTGSPFDAASFDYMAFEHLHFKCTTSGNAFDGGGVKYAQFRDMTFENTNGALAVVGSTTSCFFDQCTIKTTNPATGDLISGASSSMFFDCEFIAQDDLGTDFSGGNTSFVRCKYNSCQMEANSEAFYWINCLFEPGASKSGIDIQASCDLAVAVDCIFQDATSDGTYGIDAVAGYSVLWGHNNNWWALGTGDTSYRNNVANYPGDGDVENDDPNLDGNDIPGASSPAIGVGSTTNGNIGRRESAVGAGAGGAALSRVRLGQ